MPVAQSGCGALTATVAAYSPIVALCHCTDCQRRTGSPFGVGGYFPAAAVVIAGQSREWARSTATGGMLTNRFCPTCGSTVFWTTGQHSGADRYRRRVVRRSGLPATAQIGMGSAPDRVGRNARVAAF